MRPARPFVDYYSVLEVQPDASDGEIRRSFRRLVLKAHPDKNPDRSQESERRIRELIQAYEVVGDANRRQRFDAEYRIRKRAVPARKQEVKPFFFTRSDPHAYALRILHYLLHGRGGEAAALLERLESRHGPAFLRESLDRKDYLDCLFLLGEHFIARREYLEALKRMRTIYLHERAARYPRHYLDSVVAHLKDLYLRRLPHALPPDEALYFLSEAEELDLDGSEREGLSRIAEQLRAKAEVARGAPAAAGSRERGAGAAGAPR